MPDMFVPLAEESKLIIDMGCLVLERACHDLQFEENDRMNGLAEEILLGKTLDFLKSNVSVETISEPSVAPAATE